MTTLGRTTATLLGAAVRGLFAAVALAALVGGLPYALVHYVGWPFPDHVPAWPELQGFLLAPMSTEFLIDFLACACWITWFRFVIDVLRSGIDIARLRGRPDLSAAGPMRTLACVLVGAVLLTILGSRTAATPSTATAGTGLPPQPPVAYVMRDLRTALPPTSVVVGGPENGVHDSLWRIAERTLGDGARWPEIFRLNKDKPQPGGRMFTDPGLVYPGQELALPVPSEPPSPAAGPPAPPAATSPPPTTSSVPTSSARPSAPQPPAPGTAWASGLMDDLYVGLGLAAAVSTALAIARRRHRARYRPGSGEREDFPVAPAVYALRLAHVRAEEESTDTAAQAESVGVQDGHEVTLRLASVRGLGLIGPGATSAFRALLIATAAERPPARIVIPANDLEVLLSGQAVSDPLPNGLHVTADLHEALDELEAELLLRPGEAGRPRPRILLAASAPSAGQQRLQALLNKGTESGLAGILLGQWQHGGTAFVRADGTVSITSPGSAEPLRGTRMFHMAGNSAVELLAVLRHLDDEPVDHHPVPQTSVEHLEIAAEGPISEPPPCSRERQVAPEEVPPPLIRISVLGVPRIFWRPGGDQASAEREVTGTFQPRTRELLVFLAVHPDGASREALVAALWPDIAIERSTNALNTALSRLRRAVGAATEATLHDIVLTGEGRFQLDSNLVKVDFWRFDAAVAARRTASTDQDRTAANSAIVEAYQGVFADGMSTEWLETAREAIRRDALDAVAGLARTLVDEEPQQTLDLLEMARAFDPHNEAIYRDIMRLQARLGQFDAVPRTLALLSTRLAEIDDQPTEEAIRLARTLGNRDSGTDRAST